MTECKYHCGGKCCCGYSPHRGQECRSCGDGTPVKLVEVNA